MGGTRSSGEQTSGLQSSTWDELATTTVSVVEEIRRFEGNIEQNDSSQSHLEWQRLKGPPSHRPSHLSTSMDSLLDSEPATGVPRPTTPPQPARRRLAGSSPQKRVTIATDQLVTVHSMSCSPELEIEDCEAETPPCLPSVRELAVRFQPRKSPEPKPRRSLLKKKAAERLQKSAAASAYQVHSLTARSVPRAFRDGLRRGGVTRDHIGAHAAKDHVIAHREPHQVVRREEERSSSPEHSGIPAVPVVITARRAPAEQGYTSDESIQQPRRRERRVDRVSWA